MALTLIPSAPTDVPSAITNVPSAITNDPTHAGLTRVTDITAGVASHLLDGSGNILAVTVGVDQLTNA